MKHSSRFKRRVSPAAAIQGSLVFREYQTAFYAATGLSIAVHGLKAKPTLPCRCEAYQAALAKEGTNVAALCGRFQRCMFCVDRGVASRTKQCPGGLWMTAIPIRNGNRAVAIIHAGPLQITRSDSASQNVTAAGRFNGYQPSTVSKNRYVGYVALLEIFARELGRWFAQHASATVDRERPRVIRAVEWIELHYHEPIGLADVAKALHLSTWQFCRTFSRGAGITFREALQSTRIRHAKELLADPASTISEIAFAVGFQSLSQFNRVFRKLVGTSAQQYRLTIEPSEHPIGTFATSSGLRTIKVRGRMRLVTTSRRGTDLVESCDRHNQTTESFL